MKQLTNNNATLSRTENVKAVMKRNVKLLMIISAGIANVLNLFLFICKWLVLDLPILQKAKPKIVRKLAPFLINR